MPSNPLLFSSSFIYAAVSNAFEGLGFVILLATFGITRSLSQTERQYAQIEKECSVIVFSCKRFSQYLSGRGKITVESHQKPLRSIFQKSILSAPCRLQRVMLRLQRFNLDVKYKPGAQMYVADHAWPVV